MKKVIFFLLLIIGATTTELCAQQNYFDFTWEKKAVKERKILPYRFLREADAVYAKRIHRVIDTREKKNLPLKWPKNSLNCILYEGVTTNATGSGPLAAYRNDSLFSEFTAEEVMEIGGKEENIPVYPDPDDPYYYYDSIVYTPYECTKIVKFRVMEDWVFDKQAGIFYARIIAIAPLYKPEIEGQELPEQTMFWLKWDELRPFLVNYEVFNRHNDAAKLTFYDFFEQRLFSSYIVKEPNEFDYDIKNFEQFENDPFAALLESERIKNDLFEWEHDLWQY